MKELVIFDLDGTLINSIKDLGAATNHALKASGYPEHPLEAYPMLVGNGVRKLIERALPENAREDEIIDKMKKDFTDYYDIHNTDYTRPYEGISELLKGLRARNIKVAVASNKYHKATEKLVRHFFPDIEFAAIEGQKDGIPTKPDPSIIFEILGIVVVPKQNVLYVGDSGVDMETARRACVDSVGVTWGFRPVSELKKFYAGAIINHPDEILAIIDNFAQENIRE